MTYLAVPALIALLIKAILLAYAIRFPAKNATTRLYLILLVLLSIHNVVEVLGFAHIVQHGIDATIELFGYSYFAVGILFFAVMFHISLRLSLDDWEPVRRYVAWIYAPTIPLLFLLLFTDSLVSGFTAFKDYTIVRVPGEFYFLFETYVPLYLLASVAYLIYGARPGRSPAVRRTRNRWWLLSLSPFVLLNVYLIAANHFGLAKLSSTVFVPMAVTFFLIATAYATHQHRLFDIAFFIPGSRLRRRKTAFYRRLQDAVAELAETRSSKEAIQLVAEVLHCPVAVTTVSNWLVGSPGAKKLTAFPERSLRLVDEIVLAHEIHDRQPTLYREMTRHGVAAVIPFYVGSATAAGWLLIGNPFNDRVYTAADFRHVEHLLDRLGEALLDDMVRFRREAADVLRDNRMLIQQVRELEMELAKLRKENAMLRNDRDRWLRNKVRDVSAELEKESLRIGDSADATVDTNVTLDQYLAIIEARLIAETLQQCQGNKSEAARLLGIRPNTLHYKMVRYGISGAEQA